jgi:hypothetical protein
MNYLIVFIIVLSILYIYTSYNKKNNYDIYKFNPNTISNYKLNIWIYVNNVDELQKLCINSIINNCYNCNIIIFQNKDIKTILGVDTNEFDTQPDLFNKIYLMHILHKYGGIIIPPYLYLKDNIKKVHNNNKFYICELTNQRINKSNKNTTKSMNIMGSNKQNPQLLKFINLYTNKCKNNFNYDIFKFDTELLDNLPYIPAPIIGCKDQNNNEIYLEDLMENKIIEMSDNNIGLYIPYNELANRTNYRWYLKLNQNEMLNVKNFITYYIKS